jgi:4-hydroxybenzoate polyprenyltransferase
LQDYLSLMRLDRPVGSLLLLWPTLAALWMASDGLPTVELILIFTLGTFVMRSAGCVINDYADRHVDGSVERTKNRPLATGAIKPYAALILFACLSLVAGILVLLLNTQTQLLALGGFAVAAVYPFMKRWTHLPQTVLGAAFSWGILMAWTATEKGLNSDAGLMFIASLLWIVAYDTMYAMADRDDDLKAGIKSTAILFGDMDRFMVGVLQVCTLGVLLLLGQRLGYQHAYYASVFVCAGLFVYQQVLIRDRQPAACLAAFKNNILVGFTLFAGTVAELSIRSLLI